MEKNEGMQDQFPHQAGQDHTVRLLSRSGPTKDKNDDDDDNDMYVYV